MSPPLRLVPLLLFALLAACAQEAPAPPVKPPPAVAALPPTAKPPVKPLPALKPKTPQIPQVAPAGATVVGVILPLSGNSGVLGNALLNATQMALFDLAGPELTLLPLDSKGTAEGAAAAAREALAQHADILVGPLFAGEVRAVSPIAAAARTPVLSLSADRSVAGNGTYVLGFLPGPQALAVADYAASLGKLRQAVLAPSNEYGRRVVTELANGAPAQGITLAPIEYYDPAALDLSNAFKHLLAGRKGEDPGFDALFLPDDGQRLRRVSEQWAAQGIDPAKVALLGTMLWDDAKPGEFPSLTGAWYAAAANTGFADFARRYSKAFNQTSPRLASLAYDAMAMVAVLAKQSAHDFSPGILTNPQGFAGFDGLFRLHLDGIAERAYAIKEVVPNGPAKEVQAPAKSFGS